MAMLAASSVLAPLGRAPSGRSSRAQADAGLAQRASRSSGAASLPLLSQKRSGRAVAARSSAVTRATIAKPNPSASPSAGGDKGGFPRGSSWEIHK